MTGWTPLHQQIVGSSVWSTDYHVRILWVTMLALSDRGGVVRASVPGLARMANITRGETEDGLRVLSEPDADTLTQEHEGRRISKVEHGWLILNFAKYRATARQAYRVEAARLGMAQLRAERAKVAPEPTSAQCGPSQKEVSTPEKGERYPGKPPTWEEVKARASMIGMEEGEAKRFFDHYEAIGKEDVNGRPIWVTGGENSPVVGKWAALLAKWQGNVRANNLKRMGVKEEKMDFHINDITKDQPKDPKQ